MYLLIFHIREIAEIIRRSIPRLVSDCFKFIIKKKLLNMCICLCAYSYFCRTLRKVFDCGEDQSVVVYNSRRVHVSDAPLTAEDISLLADIEAKKVASKLTAILSSSNGKW
jgi:hypothetical protein